MIFQYKKLPTSVLKYIIICCIVIGLVIIIPYNKLGVKDSIILSIILTVTIIVIENLSSILIDETNPPQTKLDHFEITIPTPTTTTTTPKTPVSQATTTAQTSATAQQTITTPSKTITNNVVTSTNTQPTTTSKTNTNTQVPSTDAKVTVPVTKSIYEGQPNAEDKEVTGSRIEDGVGKSDMPYTDYNHIPIGDNYKPTDFEYGYSFLPPEKWYPTPPFPPVCVCEKRSPICPTYTTGTPVDVKEWHSSSKIMPPDGINTSFIKERLNAGK